MLIAINFLFALTAFTFAGCFTALTVYAVINGAFPTISIHKRFSEGVFAKEVTENPVAVDKKETQEELDEGLNTLIGLLGNTHDLFIGSDRVDKD